MKLPPMNALRVFEAVSRHGSVSRAAEELCVSQGAVSQQLRNLEDFFGKELFDRSPNSFQLTDEGETFAEVVQLSLEQIADAATKIGRVKAQQTLKISVPPTLNIKWLMPQLGAFYEKHPGVYVILDEGTHLVTFKNDGFDAAIRFGDGQFDNLHSDLLIKPILFAVASPAYIKKYGRLASMRNPAGHRLIDFYYDSKNISSQHVHWGDFIDGNIDDIDVEHLVFPDGLQSLTAAIQDQGIALVSTYLIHDELESGALEVLGEQLYEYPNRYYFVSPKDVRPNQALDNFRDWLLKISGPFRDDSRQPSSSGSR